MIVFEFEMDKGATRDIHWLGCTLITKEDDSHSDEIYEQLDAELVFNI